MDDDSSSVQSQEATAEKSTDVPAMPSKLPTDSKESSPAATAALAKSIAEVTKTTRSDDDNLLAKSSSTSTNSITESNNLVVNNNEQVKKRRDKELEVVSENGLEVTEKKVNIIKLSKYLD